MLARFVTLGVLFSASTVVSGLILAIGIVVLPPLGVAPGPWALPLAMLAGFIPLFLLARQYVLPPHLAIPAWKAAATLTVWILGTLMLWQGAMRVWRPTMRWAGFDAGTFVVLLVCSYAVLLLIDVAFRGRGVPRSPH